MSKNISQIYSSSPATSMQSDDLMYLGRSATDMAIEYVDLAASLGASLVATGYQSISSASDVTLTNPLNAYYSVSLNAGLKLTLPAMDTSDSMPVGSSVIVANTGSNPFTIYDADGNDWLELQAGNILLITLYDNSTAGGQFQFNYLSSAAPITQGQHYISAIGYLNPAITNGCSVVQSETTTNKNNFRMLQFASGATTIAIAQIPLESSVSKVSVKVKPIWQTPATSGNVTFYYDAIFRNSGDAFDAAYGTQVSHSIAAETSANAIKMGASLTVTPAYPSGTAAQSGVLELRIQRKSGDTIADVVNLIDLEVGLTIIGGVDG